MIITRFLERRPHSHPQFLFKSDVTVPGDGRGGGFHIYLLSNTLANQNEPDIVQMIVKFNFIMPPLN